MFSTEPHNSSPRRALSMLRRGRKGDKNASSADLVAAPNTGEEFGDAGVGSLKSSAFDKLKARARGHSVDRRTSNDSGRRLSTLIPGKKKRKNKDALGVDRTNSTDSNLPGNGSYFPASNGSQTSLMDESGRSSLLTEDDSDNEGRPARPTLSPHQSHAGYLTLSSPLIHAQTSASTGPINVGSVPLHHPDAAQLTPVLPSGTPVITETQATPPPIERIQRPADKFEAAFALPQTKIGGDTDSVKSRGGGGGLGGLFGAGSRRGSIVNKSTESIGVEQAAEVSQLDHSETPQERPETPKAKRGRPRINLPETPPNLVETPTTLVTPPTPTDLKHETPALLQRKPVTTGPKKQPPTSNRSSSSISLSSVESIKHRRVQSANLPPSKLSNSIAAPLTPTAEETKTPGGTLTNPTSTGGFFASVFSGVQKAADQLSNTINTSVAPDKKAKGQSTDRDIDRAGRQEVISGVESNTESEDIDTLLRRRTVDALGIGYLSLQHLGITESAEQTPMTSTIDLPDVGAQAQLEDGNSKSEEDAAARAVSAAYEKPIVSSVSQAMGGRPMSIASGNLTPMDDQIPPHPGTDLDGNVIKRSGSVRSRISARRRRHRASSATIGGTIAAAIGASTAILANPATGGAGHRLTGFAVASSKRNKEFHQLFRSVPEDDYLIEDYSAALQRDILLHGRLYVSEGHICFSSNILGWVTNLVISFDEVVSVEKKSTAVIFPNAIVIQTLHARNTFASFVARDSTYELLIGIWKVSHSTLKSSLNGVTLDDSSTGDKTEKLGSGEDEEGDEDDEEGTEDEVYDEDDEDDMGSFTEAGGNGSIAGSDVGDTVRTVNRKASNQLLGSSPQATGAPARGLEGTDAAVTGAAVSLDYPGSPTHDPTECSDAATHYDRVLTDTTIPAPLGKVYSMMFGPASGAFMRKWLVEDQKSRELSYEDDKTGLNNDHKTFTFSYIKPLHAPVGPRQTKCITTYTLDAFDLDKAVSVSCSTQTPDVPSGSVFTTKTRYCLMWGPGNTTRMIANCMIEWTGKSWLKGPIDKGANDGQMQYVKDILIALRAAATTKPPVKGAARGKGKRSQMKGEVFDADNAIAERAASVSQENTEPNWGLLESVRPLLEPIISPFKPLFSTPIVLTVLCLIVAYLWLTTPKYSLHSGLSFPGVHTPERLAAYDELWRREESELWDWLEDRAGLDHLYAPSTERQQALGSRSMGKKLRGEKMGKLEMDEAIRTTEERLQALKDAVNRKRAGEGALNSD